MVVEVAVTVLGVTLIVGELWYFLGPRPKREPARGRGGAQEVQILVKNGYEPATIFVEAGRPVRLLFYRDETAECSERVVFDSLTIDRELPPFEATAVQFTPEQSGDYPFRCGKSILRGRVVAQIGAEGARQNVGRGHAKHG